MGHVEEIKRAVLRLSRNELAAFRRWFVEFDANAWDADLEEDAGSGNLDAIAAETLAEHKGRKTM